MEGKISTFLNKILFYNVRAVDAMKGRGRGGRGRGEGASPLPFSEAIFFLCKMGVDEKSDKK